MADTADCASLEKVDAVNFGLLKRRKVMFTLRYKTAYINGYINKTECYITSDCQHFKGRIFKSLLAAKQAITKAKLINSR